MALTVRKAERQDLASLGKLGLMLVQAHYAFDQKRFLAPLDSTERGYAAFLGNVLESSDDFVFVAEKDGVIVGYVFGALEPLSWKELRGPAGFIHDLLVIEQERRSGIGTKLM